MSPPIVKLVYFDCQGRAEAIRIMLAVGKIEYEEKLFNIPPDFSLGDMKEWGTRKPSTPFWSLPILTWDGVEIAQSGAIKRFVAKKVGLAGNNDEEAAYAEEIVDHVSDLAPKLVAIRWVDFFAIIFDW